MAKPKLLLVVDDEVGVRKVMCQLLRAKGYEVIEADNGTQMFEILKESLPDAILLDIRMSTPDEGIQCCKRIRADERLKHIKVIMWSAKAELFDKSEGLRAGADAYLTKPAWTKDIIAAIETVDEK